MKNLTVFTLFFIFMTTTYAQDLSKLKECKGQTPPDKIAFNAEFFEPILAGRKIATTRKGIRCFKAGQVVKALDTDGKEHFKLKIKKVLQKTFDTLDDKIAKAEDATLKELQDGLVEIYGEEIKTMPLSVIYFSKVK